MRINKSFNLPTELPVGANCLDLLQTNIIEDDDRLKAQCIYNDQPSNRNTIFVGINSLNHLAKLVVISFGPM
jgi:hypothetical protein